MRVLFHYDTGPALAARLGDISGHGLDVVTCGEADDARFAELMAEAEVLWHVLRPVSADHIAAAPLLRLIQKIGVGVNTIDLEAARARDIRVCNMPGTNSRAVAEMTLALMLAAVRRLPAFGRAIAAGQGWAMDSGVQDHLGEIGSRTVGLVGFGAVPRALAPMLRALGARVLYSARTPKPEAEGVAERRTLRALLGESDILSLHVPLTPETARMIDEAALIAALRSGRLRAAGLDVFDTEPVKPDNPLLGLDNVVLTPHVAWLTMETIDRSLEVAVDNCRRLAAGQPLRFRVV